MIDLGRCEELLNGDIPETVAEELFIFFYYGAAEEQDFADLLLSVKDEIDEASINELHMLIYGYASGQKERKALLYPRNNNLQ